jgi:DNA-binding beta-propeller fold protein YncE
MLNSPFGIFVTTNFDLYVADSANHRIQMFRAGERNGTILVGNGAPGTINLTRPTGIVVGADGYLFIVDHGNHRIVRSGPSGSCSVVAGIGSNSSASNGLSSPVTLSFDRDGNMFVTDRDNHRIQKFQLLNNSCSESSE